MSHRILSPRSLLFVACACLPACGGDEGGYGPSGSSTTPTSDADAASDEVPEDASSQSTGSADRRRGGGSRSSLTKLDEEEVASEELGALHGTILFRGEAPERFELTAGDKSECNQHPDVEHLSENAIVNGGKVQNVFVHIARGYDEDSLPPAPAEPYLIDQRGCIYSPHVNAIQLGQKVLVQNSDPTTHNVNVKTKKSNVPGNKNMAQGQDPFEYEFTREENSIILKCDIHPWMNARLHVSEHPWFAITDASGNFRIPEVPPGTYTVEAIHEVFGKQRGEIEVKAGRSAGFSFTFEP